MFNNREYQNTLITTISQNQIFTGRGTFHGVVVGSSSIAALKIGDAITGTSATVGTLRASVAEGDYLYDTVIANGLRVTLDGATFGGGVYTVLWSK